MPSISIDAVDEYPDKLKLLGDPTRFKILQFLAEPVESYCTRDDGVCGCDLETYLKLTQPTVSHHMKQLVDAGLVTGERRGRWVYYELQPAALRELAGALEGFAAAAEARAELAPA
ncbi:MAG TPA: metalloregulator ArsR/SmtB family transcription factor [Trueperaceae bacterium]|nr:metalloregulator ArsR/SmtB family transcription factor [Trueperaceae bacterium]